MKKPLLVVLLIAVTGLACGKPCSCEDPSERMVNNLILSSGQALDLSETVDCADSGSPETVDTQGSETAGAADSTPDTNPTVEGWYLPGLNVTMVDDRGASQSHELTLYGNWDDSLFQLDPQHSAAVATGECTSSYGVSFDLLLPDHCSGEHETITASSNEDWSVMLVELWNGWEVQADWWEAHGFCGCRQ